jgi:hypothetical protein
MSPIAEQTKAVAENAGGGVLTKIDAFVTAARSASADGLTWAEFGELLVALLKLSVSLYDDVRQLSGAEKKAAVLDAVGRLFDAVADKAVPVAVYPIWIFARPAVRSLVLALAAGAIEQLLPLVRVA